MLDSIRRKSNLLVSVWLRPFFSFYTEKDEVPLKLKHILSSTGPRGFRNWNKKTLGKHNKMEISCIHLSHTRTFVLKPNWEVGKANTLLRATRVISSCVHAFTTQISVLLPTSGNRIVFTWPHTRKWLLCKAL